MSLGLFVVVFFWRGGGGGCLFWFFGFVGFFFLTRMDICKKNCNKHT